MSEHVLLSIKPEYVEKIISGKKNYEFRKKIWKNTNVKYIFYQKGLLVQLILILKYIFNRNIRAKEVQKYSARLNAYDDKTEFLGLALKIAKNIKNDNFTYGYQTDPGNSYHHYIYYFQLGKNQVSFHNSFLFSDCPKFKGQWIGYRNECFPFKLRG